MRVFLLSPVNLVFFLFGSLFFIWCPSSLSPVNSSFLLCKWYEFPMLYVCFILYPMNLVAFFYHFSLYDVCSSSLSPDDFSVKKCKCFEFSGSYFHNYGTSAVNYLGCKLLPYFIFCLKWWILYFGKQVAALVPKGELEGEMGDAHMAMQARLMSQALRKLSHSLSLSQTILIFINQVLELVILSITFWFKTIIIHHLMWTTYELLLVVKFKFSTNHLVEMSCDWLTGYVSAWKSSLICFSG